MSILITGGLGFIGSHTVVELLNSNYKNIIIIDNLSNSKYDIYNNILKICENIPDKNVEFINLDILDKKNLKELFSLNYYKNKINTVIHFAALKSVKESINLPLKYYKINVEGTINLLEIMEMYECNNFIFSSSATVYGNQEYPVYENNITGIGITNPYGRTKYMVEEILKDYSKSNSKLNITILRYFNPVGAHSSGLIGEDPNDIPNNLNPYLLKVISGKLNKLTIYGNDYNTRDGTCLRDYIHVVDLAKAHVKTLEAILNNINKGLCIYNVGSGNNISVLEYINTFEKVNNIKINYDFGSRRNGDLPVVYANVDKIFNELNWKVEKSLEDICKDSYNYIKNKNLC